MRSKLKELAGEKHIFTAKVITFGAKKGKRKPQFVLLENIKKDGELITDHLWLQRHRFKKAKPGDLVEFKGKVVYYKRIKTQELDCCIDGIRLLKVEKGETNESNRIQKSKQNLNRSRR